MPVTRSNKGSGRREPTPTTEESSGATGESGGTSGTTTEGTYPSGTSYETTTTGTVIKEGAPAENKEDPKHKSIERRSKDPHRPASIVSESRNRKKELEARAELAELELKEARAAAALARSRLELLQLEDNDSVIQEPVDREVNVQKWVADTVERMSGEGRPMEGKSGEGLTKGETVKHEDRSNTTTGGTRELAEAIMKAISASSRSATVPGYMSELPFYDGSNGEWLAFKTVYEDSAASFSSVQNMARLRKSIKGTAREAVKSLLYSECAPEEVMEALRRRFGRPDALVLAEMEKLRGLPKMSESARDVCVFASQVNNVVATVKGLKKPQYLQSPEMLKIIVDKMPAVLRYRWFDYTAAVEDVDLIHLGKFLNREADRCGPYAMQESATKKQYTRRETAHAASEQERGSCPHCQGSHRLVECKKFLDASTKQRWDIASKTKVCFKCLQGRHRKEECKKPACKECKRWHHHLLHETKHVEQSSKMESEVTNNVLQVNTTRAKKAYLKMVPVELYGPKGSARVLALLDEGSTVTMLNSSVADQIGLKGPKEALTLETVGGKTITTRDSMKVDLRIKGIHQDRKRLITGARTIDNLHLTPQMVDKKKIEELPHLSKMADQLYYEEESPELLIGQDNWELIVSRGTRKGRKNQPVASLTYLGWVLHGSDSGANKPVNFLTCAHISTREDDLDKLIREHFSVESLGVQPRRPSTDAEGKAIEILKKTTRRLDNGRFEVGLLWKNEKETMPENYKSAECRLRGIEKKLDKDVGFKEEYKKQVENLLENGYAEEAPQESLSSRKWYLPHFAVTHPTKKKRRLVFDAAAKFAGKSLNDALLSGPDLLQSLFGVLLRFRQHPVALVADIKEMFLQVKIREEDRDSLRFLWRGDRRTGKPKEYRMTSVIFGAACSPSAAIYVKNRNAEDFREQHPEAVQAIERNHYMDDYLHSFQTEKEATKIASEVDTIHRRAGFELRGWASNRSTVLKKIAHENETNKEVELGSKEEKTLGLRWFTQEDEMGFRTTLRNVQEVVEQGKTPTKREVTSAVMSTFDPMGLASPVLIQGKRLLQNIWRSGVGWDDEVTPENEEQWRRYLTNLQLLKDLRIPRCIGHSRHEGEIHVFTDSSETAYSCAVYWRQRNDEGLYDVTLLAGKARVTPLKPVSMPRLELQAALLGTRMAHSIEEELDVKVTKKTYWTDSSTVLSWIKSDPRTFKPFVAHRLAEIEDTSKPHEWRWISTKDNPADDATRDVPNEFNGKHRWFTGPAFLKEDEESWPKPRNFKAEPTGEEKETSIVTVTKVVNRFSTPDPTRYSSWNRLLRATARVLQFIDMCKRKTQRVNISRRHERADPTWGKYKKKEKEKSIQYEVKETRRLLPIEDSHMKMAEKILLRRSQEESFKEEISSLEKMKPMNRSSKLSKIDVTMEDGLIRVRGRIDAVKGLVSTFKRPVVLDSKHQVTRLLIAHYHTVFNHGNHATVINEVRQRYWVLGLRSAVRATAHQCQWCKVHRSAPQRPPVGDLPEERLRYGEPAFTSSAVDYFGPMIVTVGRRHEKRWGALFTCLTTRAVHIELAASLSSSSMILALRRMAARRGMPKSMFSDNGTNFVGANKELKEALEELKKEEVVTEAEKMGVRWKFTAPGGPNMGGAWERLVRSIKTALGVTLKEKFPKEEVLHTLLLEAEHIVNSRPLVDVAEDQDEEAITPNHFLIGRSSGMPRLGAFTDEDFGERRDWKVAQRLIDHFWARWVKEYLPTLIPRKVDGKITTRDLQCGDTVLIVDSTLPRGTWPRGEVVRVYPGPDGHTRVIDVRTTGGVLRRPSTKVVLLVPARDDGGRDNESPANRASSNGVARPGVGAAHEGEDVSDASTEINTYNL